jgi:hypothetical protein
MTLKVVLVSLLTMLAMSAGQIFFTAPSIPALGALTAANQVFNNTGPGSGNSCATADCSFAYNNSNDSYLFGISTASGDPGLIGLLGNIGVEAGGVVTSGQTFGVGPITGNAGNAPGDVENANVALPAGIQLIINDGGGTAASDYFTASITSFNLTSTEVSAFEFNLGGVVNLTNFAYTGTNAALQILASNPAGIMQETFTLAATNGNLTDLFQPSNNGLTTAFQLAVSTVPEPRFYGLLLCGLLGLVGIVIRRRRAVNA